MLCCEQPGGWLCGQPVAAFLVQTSVSPSHTARVLCCRRQQGALEQAAVSAERQADDLRSRLAGAQSKWQLAQAAADAAAQERTQLMQQVAQELNRASLVEQVRNWHGLCSSLLRPTPICLIVQQLHVKSTRCECVAA